MRKCDSGKLATRPIRALAACEVQFTIATDGPEMMRTHLRDEFELLRRISALDESQVSEANRRARGELRAGLRNTADRLNSDGHGTANVLPGHHWLLAQNERRPALREDLSPEGDWTKLTVSRHSTSVTLAAVCDKLTD